MSTSVVNLSKFDECFLLRCFDAHVSCYKLIDALLVPKMSLDDLITYVSTDNSSKNKTKQNKKKIMALAYLFYPWSGQADLNHLK
jgi:hypothetical protein